jgi:16S rRNA (guanine527-N7)-methyltransferase
MTVAQQLSAGIAALGLELPEGAEEKLLAYLALLDKWNRVYNLTAVREAERMVSHHLLDSLAVVGLLDALVAERSPSPQPSPLRGEPRFGDKAANVMPGTINLLDVGSGGGLPGIPLAIARPNLQVTLIDSIAKKTAFLLQAKAELGLDNVNVVTGRVEDYRPTFPSPDGSTSQSTKPASRQVAGYPPQAGEGEKGGPKPVNGFDVITSRAFSDLREFVTLTRHLLEPGGCWLAMKGLYPNEEIALLPAGVQVRADHALVVPGLDATRHLIVLESVE